MTPGQPLLCQGWARVAPVLAPGVLRVPALPAPPPGHQHRVQGEGQGGHQPGQGRGSGTGASLHSLHPPAVVGQVDEVLEDVLGLAVPEEVCGVLVEGLQQPEGDEGRQEPPVPQVGRTHAAGGAQPLEHQAQADTSWCGGVTHRVGKR